MKILSDGFTQPNPVGPNVYAVKAIAAAKKLRERKAVPVSKK
jgi:hypothetical protein